MIHYLCKKSNIKTIKRQCLFKNYLNLKNTNLKLNFKLFQTFYPDLWYLARKYHATTGNCSICFYIYLYLFIYLYLSINYLKQDTQAP